MKRPSRTPSKLSESLHQRLNAYALAASAAGVGMLALAQPVGAKIVYTSANIQIGQRHALDLNHDGTTDFVFVHKYWDYSSSVFAESRRKNMVWGSSGLASALSSGVSVGSNQKFAKYNSKMWGINCHGGSSTCNTVGKWYNVQNRYLGLKFYVRGKTHYGWARLSFQQAQPTLTGYAYETIPNKSIIAGKTKGKDVISVGPASLGHLARGASAIPAWRQKQ